MASYNVKWHCSPLRSDASADGPDASAAAAAAADVFEFVSLTGLSSQRGESCLVCLNFPQKVLVQVGEVQGHARPCITVNSPVVAVFAPIFVPCSKTSLYLLSPQNVH